MNRTEANAVNERRGKNPTADTDYLAVQAEIKKHRRRLVRYLRVHDWLTRWCERWSTQVAELGRKTPGSVEWYQHALDCIDLFVKLTVLRQAEATQPGDPGKMDLPPVGGKTKNKDFERRITLLILLHLRGSRTEKKLGANALNFALGTKLAFPDPPWSQTALGKLAAAMGWGETLAGEIKKEAVVRGLLPDVFVEVSMPKEEDLIAVLTDILTVVYHPRTRNPGIDLPIGRLKIAAALLAGTTDDVVDRIREDSQDQDALYFVGGAYDDCTRIGPRLHEDYTRFKPGFRRFLFAPLDQAAAKNWHDSTCHFTWPKDPRDVP